MTDDPVAVALARLRTNAYPGRLSVVDTRDVETVVAEVRRLQDQDNLRLRMIDLKTAHENELIAALQQVESTLTSLRGQTCETCNNAQFMSGEGMTGWCALMRVRSCIPRYCGAWQKRREP
jgi:hypothetical protein